MKTVSTILIVICYLMTSTLLAQSAEIGESQSASSYSTASKSPRVWHDLRQDFTYGVRSVGYTYARPLHWQKKDWLVAGGITLGVLGMYLVEEEVNPFFVRQAQHVPRAIDRFAFYFGKPQYNYGLTAGIYTIGLLSGSPKWRRTGMVLIASATAAGLIQTVSKTALGRARPSTGVGNSAFDWFNGTPDYHSFPSGHTVLAVVTAHALAKQTRNPWLKGGIYALGTITPISRLYTQAHWLSDVGLSVALSVVVVESVDRFFQNRTGTAYGPHIQKKTVSWRPLITTDQIGLSLNF